MSVPLFCSRSHILPLFFLINIENKITLDAICSGSVMHTGD